MAELGTLTGHAARVLAAPLFHILDQRSLVSYLGAAVFVLFAAVLASARRARVGLRWRAFWRLLARRSVWRHRSALLDYKLYLFNMPLIAFALGYFIVGGAFWADMFGDVLVRLFGPPATTSATTWPLVACIAVLHLLALDLGYWLGHAAMHRSEILWQFHKLHHSAEVMTPATEYRQHPVELILMPTVISLVTGLSFAAVTHWCGTGAAAMGVTGFNAIALVHLLTFHHVRHSHINMPFTGWMGVIFHSPAHHQLHHSNDPAHHNCNMGYVLSVWDWAAGTLRMPRVGGRVTLGVCPSGAEHAGVASALWVPLRDAGRVIARRRRRTARAPAAVLQAANRL